MVPNTSSAKGRHLQRPIFGRLRIGANVLSRRLVWLVVTRVSLLAISTLALVLYIVGIPTYFSKLYNYRTACSDECLTSARIQALHALGISIPTYAMYWVMVNLLFALVYCAVAALIIWRKSDDRIAWFASFSLVVLGTSFPTIPNVLVDVRSIWWLPVTLLDALGLPSLITFLFLFPNGRFVPHWTRWVAIGFAILYMLGTFFPNTFLGYANWPRPFHPLVPLTVLGLLVFAQIYRYRQISTPGERQQTKWVVFGVTAALIGFAPAFLLPSFISVEHLTLLTFVLTITSTYLVLLLIPLSISIAILRYRLWDIDIIINRTLVYGILTVCVAASYIAIVGLLGALLQARGNVLISLLAAGCVAVLFQPLRSWLQRATNRLMYGKRDEPYQVISQLGQRLEATLAPNAVLPTIVETVSQALKLPYVAITLKQNDTFPIAASYGTPQQEEVVRFPLTYQAEYIGELLLAPRAHGETFTHADHRLLADLTRQAGVAAHAVRLTADLKRLTMDLQCSREHLVTAREEERRRLRRDLHDGLGPQLASLTLKLETARNRLAHDPLADILLSDLTTRTQNAVADIRHLVYALRPPALDELGLIPALREQALQYQGQHEQLTVSIDAPRFLPSLPAAVEVAVFRIAQEALTNVVRHAQADYCIIRLELDETIGILKLEVQDNGQGLSPKRIVGVGLHSMRERAEELGGAWTIESLPAGGTHIVAQLPYGTQKKVNTTNGFSHTTYVEEN